MSRTRLLCLGALALTVGLWGPARAGEPALPRPVLEAPPSDAERALLELVRGAVSQPGELVVFKGRKVLELSFRDAVAAGLDKNLTIRRQSKAEDVVKAARDEAKALFDPVFTLAGTHFENATFNRSEVASRFKEGTIDRVKADGTVEHVLVFSDSAQQSSQIKELVYRDPKDPRFAKELIVANTKDPNSPLRHQAYDFNIAQQLPWGPTLNIGVATVRNMTFNDREKKYYRPWATTANISVAAPFPFAKGFGPYAPSDVSLKLAGYNKDRAFWDTKTVINLTLLQVDQAYWNLVGAGESLRATLANRKLVESLRQEIQRLLDDKRITVYGLHQADAQVASVKQVEAAAWNNYVQASNALANLLDLDRQAILIPRGFSQRLDQREPWTEAEAFDTGLRNRPDLLAQRTGQQSSDLLLEYQRIQNRPDLQLGANWGVIQSESLYGYKTMDRSIAGLGQPDTLTQTYGLTYNYPVFNRGVKADYDSARAGALAQALTVRSTENTVEQDVSNAVAGLLSAKAQLAYAQENLAQAQLAFSEAQAMHAAAKTTQFEILTKSGDLLNADLSRISAAISYKLAESQLLAAEGVLAAKYASLTSSGPIEDTRLYTLAISKALRFFGSPAR